MRIKIIALTPELATEFLRTNIENNRSPSKSHVARLVRAMKNKTFNSENGQTIVRSRSGELLDGQHRCLAVAESGVTIPIILVEDVETISLITIDSKQLGRSNCNAFEFAGYKNAKVLSATVSNIFAYEKISTDFVNSKRTSMVGATELLAYLDENPDIVETIQSTKLPTSKLTSMLPLPVVFAMLCIVKRSAPDYYDAYVDFCNELANPTNTTSPAYLLRERLTSRKTKSTHMNTKTKAAIFLKAWSRWAVGEDCPKAFLIWTGAYGKRASRHFFPSVYPLNGPKEESIKNKLKEKVDRDSAK